MVCLLLGIVGGFAVDDLEQLIKASSQVGWSHLRVVDWHRH